MPALLRHLGFAEQRSGKEGAVTVDAELFGDALPTYLTQFVGRRDECAELTAMLDEPGLVTVCGLGGSGKTRLAIDVAKGLRTDQDVGRIWWVPLATAASPGEVAPAIGHALGVGGSPIDYLGQIRAVLGAGRTLLVLDNCEHVALGCRELLPRRSPVPTPAPCLSERDRSVIEALGGVRRWFHPRGQRLRRR